MKISHVIRGEDLLPSTPRQLEIIRAIGAEPPAYAHLPLIVGPDRQPLSKRHGSVAVEWFREEGYLPEALVNYLALLGWSYDDTTTFFDREELVDRFDLDRVSHNSAAFDAEKLRWMNGHYIRESPDVRLVELLTEALSRAGVRADPKVVATAIPLVKTRMHTIKLLGPERAEYLRETAARLEAVEEWKADEIRAVLESLKNERELSNNHAFQPIRAAVTGTTVSPPLFESMELLGPARTLARLRAAAARGESSAR